MADTSLLIWLIFGFALSVVVILILVFYFKKGPKGLTSIDTGSRKNPLLLNLVNGDASTFLGVENDPDPKFKWLLDRPLGKFSEIRRTKILDGSLVTKEKGAVPGMCQDGVVCLVEDINGRAPFLDALNIGMEHVVKRMSDQIEQLRAEATSHQLRERRATKGLEQGLKSVKALQDLSKKTQDDDSYMGRSRVGGISREGEF